MAEAVSVPADAAAVARRYRRVERLVSGAVALGIGLTGAAAVLVLPPLRALVPIVALVVLVRAPVFRSGGRARLRTDADPEVVRDDFAGPTPPPLALQWGIADAVRSTDDAAIYEISYLFGLRSVAMHVDADVLKRGDAARVELTATAGDQPWGTYTATVEPVADGTEISVAVGSDRQFGLRRLPQHLVARRYRDAALEAQGYAVIERSFSLSR